MAPEQAEGRTELHAPVTDIYALGGILYKILAGQSPTAPSASVSGPTGQRRLNFVPSPPPSKINKDADPLLEQMCLRAMATDPAGRYPRALELGADIQRWLDEHPLSLKRESAVGMVVREHGGVIILGLLVVVVGLILMLLVRG
jgi:serine/threonine protein kinase